MKLLKSKKNFNWLLITEVVKLKNFVGIIYITIINKIVVGRDFQLRRRQNATSIRGGGGLRFAVTNRTVTSVARKTPLCDLDMLCKNYACKK